MNEPRKKEKPARRAVVSFRADPTFVEFLKSIPCYTSLVEKILTKELRKQFNQYKRSQSKTRPKVRTGVKSVKNKTDVSKFYV